MTRLVAILGLSLLVCCAAPLRAQESAQDLFLKIYLLIQDADKLENAGQKASAHERYNVSLARLEDLKNNHPQWEPTIVNFRLKYCQEKVKALQGLADDNPGQVVAPIDPSLLASVPPPEPVIRGAPPPAEPAAVAATVTAPPSVTPLPTEPVALPPQTPAPGSATTGQDYIAKRAPTIFEMEGTTAPPAYESPAAIPPSTGRPQVSYTPSEPAPAPAYASPSAPPAPVATMSDLPGDPAQLKERIRDLEGQLASTKDRLDRATTEAAQLRTRATELEQQLQSARSGSGEQQVAALMQENQKLKQQLATAEQTIANIQLGGGGEQSVLKLQEQIDKLQDQLELARQENTALRQTNEEYRQKLEGLQLKLDQSAPDDSVRKENAMLKDIIRRQVKEQTRREVAKRMAYEELGTMAVDSQRLKTQLDILASPLVELSEEERALLREPAATLVQESAAASPGASAATASLSAPLESAGSQAVDYSSRPRVPAEFRQTAEEANRLFKQGSFDEAAAQYTIILNTYPESLYALSNLAVVRFQQGNYPEAEQYLSRAIKLAPQDAFSHSILGIALYQQGKYDEAVQILSRATALDPNDPKTRNYLGIAASQKGWQEAAEQECRKAIEIDPQYGDAHFNLAVIYATQKPPARELSRRHYNRALELGVPRDQQLESLIR